MEKLTHIKNLDTDFFITGNDYIRDGLDLKFIPHKHADTDAHVGGRILPTLIKIFRKAT